MGKWALAADDSIAPDLGQAGTNGWLGVIVRSFVLLATVVTASFIFCLHDAIGPVEEAMDAARPGDVCHRAGVKPCEAGATAYSLTSIRLYMPS